MTAATDPTDRADVNPLPTLLERCVLRVDRDGRFGGTGFFVAPGEVLTCAHVVHGASEITVTWTGGSSPVTVVARVPALNVGDPRERFYPFPDVALLRLSRPPQAHPCVALDDGEPVAGPPASVLRISAWTRDEYRPGSAVFTSAVVEFEGRMEVDGSRLLKLTNGQIVQGFSGAPLLNTSTGRVCGHVESSRDLRTALGGFGVPLSSALDALPGLRDRNLAHHRSDPGWAETVRRERELVALRAGEQHRLPLVEPLLPLRWDGDGSRADLLHPRYGVVPFLGRDTLLADLMLWRESSEPLGVVALCGPGGFGKTRTAAEACAAATRAGWTAGLLSVGADGPDGRLRRLAEWPGRLLVAVDYAETRPGIVAELLAGLHARESSAPPARIVLITRRIDTKAELRRLFAASDARLEITGLIDRADVMRLDRDVEEVDRLELFRQAAVAFDARLGRPHSGSPSPTLTADHFGRPLYVLAAALLTVENADLDVDDLATDDLLAEILDRHESEYWQRWNERLGVGLSREDQRRAVALAAVLGADTARDATALVQRLPGFADARGERLQEVARWLAHLYGSGDLGARPAVVPLEPDLLAEALVTRVQVSDGPV